MQTDRKQSVQTMIVVLLLLFSTFLSSVQAQDEVGETSSASTPTSSPEATSQERPPQEIIVSSQMSMIQLRSLIIEKEESMFDLYNELNEDDYYDMRCYWEAPMNSKIKEWVCNPEFLIQAKTEEASSHIIRAQGFTSIPPRPVFGIVVSEYPKMKERMGEIMADHPELFDAVIELNELREELGAREDQ